METYEINSKFTVRQIQNTAFNVLMAYSSCLITVGCANEKIKLIESRKTMDPKLISIAFGDNSPDVFEYPEEVGKFVDRIPLLIDEFAKSYNLSLGEDITIFISNTGTEKNPYWNSLFNEDMESEDELYEKSNTSIIVEKQKYMDKYESIKSPDNAVQIFKFKDLMHRFHSFMNDEYEKLFLVQFVCKNDHIGVPSHIMICVDKVIMFPTAYMGFSMYRPDLEGCPFMREPEVVTYKEDILYTFKDYCELAKNTCRKITNNNFGIFYYAEEKDV